MKVGLNYEDPSDTSKVSSLTFGYFDTSNVENGAEGLIRFDNVGTDNWSVMLSDIAFGGQ